MEEHVDSVVLVFFCMDFVHQQILRCVHFFPKQRHKHEMFHILHLPKSEKYFKQKNWSKFCDVTERFQVEELHRKYTKKTYLNSLLTVSVSGIDFKKLKISGCPKSWYWIDLPSLILYSD